MSQSLIVFDEPHTNRNKRYNIWNNAKKRAKAKNIDFTITLDDIPVIPDKCPVLGIPIIVHKGVHSPGDNSPSLDRIDNTKGYIKGNIRIISHRANRLKADATIEELRKVLEDYEQLIKQANQ